MKHNLGINEKDLKTITVLLNALLADETLLYVKTRNYHWNVKGPNFSELHKFFEAQYDELEKIIDEVAERVVALGGKAAGSLSEYLKATRLSESVGSSPKATAMIDDLLEDHETLVRQLRQDLAVTGEKHHDMGTSDFLTGLMEQHEKMAWMLRAHLEV